ncbi:thymosin beta-4-like [Molossus molossus]|nr:thymosin beta-4-like [Molossus molossus]
MSDKPDMAEIGKLMSRLKKTEMQENVFCLHKETIEQEKQGENGQ